MSTRCHKSGKMGPLLLCAAIVSAGMVSFSAYYFILDHFFTGTDTLTLIETSQIHSFSDVVGFFTEPLMADSKFVEIGRFFRPIASLSYSLDYAIWDLNPFGFQLTNLILNTSVSCLLVIVMYQLSKGNLLFAWLSGIIFALHPILVESVPAIDRRHDILAAVFLLTSYSFFMKRGATNSPNKLTIFLSICFYCLALGSKETAVIMPLVVSGQVYLTSCLTQRSQRFISTIKQTSLYWMTTAAYIAWRTIVLEGLGGYTQNGGLQPGEKTDYVFNIIYNYFIDLVYPADPIGVLNSCFANWWILVALAFLGLYIISFLRTETMIQNSSYRRESINLVVLLGLWSLLPLLLFLITLTFAHRSMYNSAIPFSALLAYPLAESLKKISLGSFRPSSWSNIRIANGPSSRQAVLALGIPMFCYLVICSPLVSNYDQWGASARIGRIILTNLAAGAQDIPQDCKVNLYNLPDGLRSYESKDLKAKEVTYLSDYSIKSWLRLCGFKKNLDVVIHSRSRPWDFSGDLSVAMMQLGKKNIFAIVKTDQLAQRSKLMNMFP